MSYGMHTKKPALAACVSNPKAEKVETGGPLAPHACWSGSVANLESTVFNERPCLPVKGGFRWDKTLTSGFHMYVRP